jgi:hypothetical protein
MAGSLKSLIREGSENAIFRLPLSKKPRMDFLRPYRRAPSGAPESMAGSLKSLIREGSENAIFRLPLSKKPRMDFLRPYQ